MTETLVIRLRASVDAPASWLIVDANGARSGNVQSGPVADALARWPRLEAQQVDAERLVGQILHPAHLVADAVGRDRRHAQRAETARLGHGGAQFGVGHAAHTREHHRMLDAKDVA